jgi:hypothetical protein
MWGVVGNVRYTKSCCTSHKLNTHAHTHIPTDKHTRAHHTYTHTHIHPQGNTHFIGKHSHLHTQYTHAQTHTHTHINTHKNIHTHTCASVQATSIKLDLFQKDETEEFGGDGSMHLPPNGVKSFKFDEVGHTCFYFVCTNVCCTEEHRAKAVCALQSPLHTLYSKTTLWSLFRAFAQCLLKSSSLCLCSLTLLLLREHSTVPFCFTGEFPPSSQFCALPIELWPIRITGTPLLCHAWRC